MEGWGGRGWVGVVVCGGGGKVVIGQSRVGWGWVG